MLVMRACAELRPIKAAPPLRHRSKLWWPLFFEATSFHLLSDLCSPQLLDLRSPLSERGTDRWIVRSASYMKPPVDLESRLPSLRRQGFGSPPFLRNLADLSNHG